MAKSTGNAFPLCRLAIAFSVSLDPLKSSYIFDFWSVCSRCNEVYEAFYKVKGLLRVLLTKELYSVSLKVPRAAIKQIFEVFLGYSFSFLLAGTALSGIIDHICLPEHEINEERPHWNKQDT